MKNIKTQHLNPLKTTLKPDEKSPWKKYKKRGSALQPATGTSDAMTWNRNEPQQWEINSPSQDDAAHCSATG